LEAYVRREGHAQVPQDWREDGEGLGIWVAVQRRRYRQAKLSTDRQRRLTELPGWTWKIRSGTSRWPWDQSFSLLEAYVVREGHTRVPYSHMEDSYRLGAWVSGQRRARQRGQLSAERQQRLEELPGWTWKITSRWPWDQSFLLLKAYVRRYGHADVPRVHLEGERKLGAWVSQQRRDKRLGQLSGERQQRLEGLPGWAWEETWERRFSLLMQFVNREGHALVPVSHAEDGYRLGAWVGNTARRQAAGHPGRRTSAAAGAVARLGLASTAGQAVGADVDSGIPDRTHERASRAKAIATCRILPLSGAPDRGA